MKYVLENTLSDAGIDVLLNATDYIGNRPHCFGATRNDLNVMQLCPDFRSYVDESLTEEEITWDIDSQEQCADFVWARYREWQRETEV